MNVPDYSGTAVTIHVDGGFSDGYWRNVCPVGCPWHGSDWVGRSQAVSERDEEQRQHQCLRAGPQVDAGEGGPAGIPRRPAPLAGQQPS